MFYVPFMDPFNPKHLFLFGHYPCQFGNYSFIPCGQVLDVYPPLGFFQTCLLPRDIVCLPVFSYATPQIISAYLSNLFSHLSWQQKNGRPVSVHPKNYTIDESRPPCEGNTPGGPYVHLGHDLLHQTCSLNLCKSTCCYRDTQVFQREAGGFEAYNLQASLLKGVLTSPQYNLGFLEVCHQPSCLFESSDGIIKNLEGSRVCLIEEKEVISKHKVGEAQFATMWMIFKACLLTYSFQQS